MGRDGWEEKGKGGEKKRTFERSTQFQICHYIKWALRHRPGDRVIVELGRNLQRMQEAITINANSNVRH